MKRCVVVSAVLVVVLVGVVVPAVVGASGAAVTQRPIQEFLDAQWSPSCCDPLGQWCGLDTRLDKAFRMAVVDVSFTDWLEQEADLPVEGTVDGTVSERALPDGRAEVTVVLHARNAVTWVFGEWPATLFGAAAFALLPWSSNYDPTAVPARGDADMRLVFINTGPGDPLPGFLSLLASPEPGQEFISLDFTATAFGPLHEAFGVPEGTRGMMTMQSQLVAAEGGGAVPRGPMPEDGWCPANWNVILRPVGTATASP